MASLREIKKNEKKQRITDAAVKVMARQGFHGTTVAQIAKEAGVADGTLYLYFQNKDELLKGIFEIIMDRFIGEGLRVLQNVSSPIEKLQTIARLHLRKVGSNDDLARIFQIEFRHNIDSMRSFSQTKLRNYFEIMGKIIQEGQEANQIRKDIDPWLSAKIIFGALDQMATNWVLRTKDYSLERMAEPVIDIMIRGICTPEQHADWAAQATPHQRQEAEELLPRITFSG